ncbi:unnamed protein product, partial [Polarella glacialis]
DPELDQEEGGPARLEAQELRQQANALSHHAQSLKEPKERHDKLCEAMAMYCRADSLVTELSHSRPMVECDRDLALQCRLNAACLAHQASASPSGGDSGKEQAAQAEAAAGRLSRQALDIDDENQHAALLLAQLAAGRKERDTAGRWLERARSWAQKRGDEVVGWKGRYQRKPRGSYRDEVVQTQSAELLRQLRPPPPSQGRSPSDWVKQGVLLLRQRRAQEA